MAVVVDGGSGATDERASAMPALSPGGRWRWRSQFRGDGAIERRFDRSCDVELRRQRAAPVAGVVQVTCRGDAPLVAGCA